MKYVLITGASSGIGFASALAFSKRGKNLILVARRKERLEELKRRIREIDDCLDVIIKVLDLSDITNVYTLFNELEDLQIETLINNAGFNSGYLPLLDADVSKMEQMINLNITALMVLTTLYIKKYANVDNTQVINVSSTGGYNLVKKAVNYCASKFFVSAFSEGLHKELKSCGAKVTVKVLAPSATDTEFFAVASNNKITSCSEMYRSYNTSEEMANYLLKLYDSNSPVGYVNRTNFTLELSDYILNHL